MGGEEQAAFFWWNSYARFGETRFLTRESSKRFSPHPRTPYSPEIRS